MPPNAASAASMRRAPSQERSRFLVDAILSATERVLADKGLTRTSVRAVARVAGVSVGSLYQYFDGKDSLVGTLIDRRLDADMHKVRKVLAEHHETPIAELALAGVSLLVPDEEWKKDATVSMMDALGDVDESPRLRRVMKELVEIMTEFLRARPEIDDSDAPQVARTLVFATRAAAREAMKASDPWDAGSVRADLTRLIVGYLGPR